MRQIVSLVILIVLFALAFPTLLSVGEIIEESDYALRFIQVVLIIITVLVLFFTYFFDCARQEKKQK